MSLLFNPCQEPTCHSSNLDMILSCKTNQEPNCHSLNLSMSLLCNPNQEPTCHSPKLGMILFCNLSQEPICHSINLGMSLLCNPNQEPICHSPNLGVIFVKSLLKNNGNSSTMKKVPMPKMAMGRYSTLPSLKPEEQWFLSVSHCHNT